MRSIYGISLMAHWASWRLAGGNQQLGRLMLHAGSRVVVWSTARHLADGVRPMVVSMIVVIMSMVTVALCLIRFRQGRLRARPTHRHPTSPSPPKGVPR